MVFFLFPGRQTHVVPFLQREGIYLKEKLHLKQSEDSLIHLFLQTLFPVDKCHIHACWALI